MVPNCPEQVLLHTYSYRYGQRCAEPHQQKGLGMKKDFLTVKKLAAELRMSSMSIQRSSRKEEVPALMSLCSLAVALGYI